MSRLVATGVLLLAILWTAVVAVGDTTDRPIIDLNKPGAFEALQLSNPTHYDRICKILEGILQRPDPTVPHWMQTNFDAQNVSYVPILMTSEPPKRRLSFDLDETHYEAVVTITNEGAEIFPLH